MAHHWGNCVVSPGSGLHRSPRTCWCPLRKTAGQSVWCCRQHHGTSVQSGSGRHLHMPPHPDNSSETDTRPKPISVWIEVQCNSNRSLWKFLRTIVYYADCISLTVFLIVAVILLTMTRSYKCIILDSYETVNYNQLKSSWVGNFCITLIRKMCFANDI